MTYIFIDIIFFTKQTKKRIHKKDCKCLMVRNTGMYMMVFEIH